MKKVCFLGRKYEVSDGLPLYRQIKCELTPVMKKLQSHLHGENTLLSSWQNTWEKYVNEVAKDVIIYVQKYNVYDLTISSLKEENPYYEEMRKDYRSCIDFLNENIDQLTDNAIEKANQARLEANKKITGSSVGILTNSVASMIAYGITNSIITAGQQSGAQSSYNKELGNIVGELGERKTEVSQIVNDEIFAKRALSDISNLMTYIIIKLLEKLDEKGVICLDEVQTYSYVESQGILDNYDITKNVETLYKSFEKDPTNINIYYKLIELDYIDFDTFQTAKWLKMEYELIPYLKKYGMERALKQDISRYINVLVSYDSSHSERSYYKEFYNDNINISDKFKNITKCFDDYENIGNWINENIDDKSYSKLVSSEKKLYEFLCSKIRKILPKTAFEKLSSFNLVYPEMYGSKVPLQYDDMIDFLVKKIIRQVNQYIRKEVDNVEKIINSINIKLEEVIKLLNDREELISTEQKKEELLNVKTDKNEKFFIKLKRKKLVIELRIKLRDELNNYQLKLDSIEKELEAYLTNQNLSKSSSFKTVEHSVKDILNRIDQCRENYDKFPEYLKVKGKKTITYSLLSKAIIVLICLLLLITCVNFGFGVYFKYINNRLYYDHHNSISILSKDISFNNSYSANRKAINKLASEEKGVFSSQYSGRMKFNFSGGNIRKLKSINVYYDDEFTATSTLMILDDLSSLVDKSYVNETDSTSVPQYSVYWNNSYIVLFKTEDVSDYDEADYYDLSATIKPYSKKILKSYKSLADPE